MEKDSGIGIAELRVDGGATVNDRLMQFQSDLLQTVVVRPGITETSAIGAAYFAGLAVGFWKDIGEIRKQWQIERKFTPSISVADSALLIGEWQRAIKASVAWSGYSLL
jgi:glycerol kinase